jgi:CheY-like chemotaxis protein
MPKVLLVEDDNNLREIFQMRLQAEGYTAVVAADGEEGLVVAMKEKPDLVIADVMMPKLSGFEMVESLRAAPETKDIKVIMMTALGQAEDQARGEKLGVLKYLVKSQVTLEDFARVVKEALGPGNPSAAPAAQNEVPNNTNQQESETRMQPQDPSTNPTPAPADDAGAAVPAEPATPAPAEPSVIPVSGDAAADNSVSTDQQSTAQEQQVVDSQVSDAMGAPAADTSMPSADAGATSTDAPAMPPASEPAPAPEAPAPQSETPPAADSGSNTGNAL